MILAHFLVYNKKSILTHNDIDKYVIVTLGEIRIVSSFWKYILSKIVKLFGYEIEYVNIDYDIAQVIPESLSGCRDAIQIQNEANVQKSECLAYLRNFSENNKEKAAEIVKLLKEYRNGKR